MNTLLNEQDSDMLANSIIQMQTVQHEEKLNLLIEEQNLVIVKTYNLVPYKDGDKWCVLLGKNLQEGICGFGDTPYKAILDFNTNFYNK